MLSVLDALDKATGFLARHGVANARLDSEWIFAHVLNCRRLDLYLQFERPLDEANLARLRSLLKRRGSREPLQYILGHTLFYGLSLKTDRRALIPRPETEELVEHIIQILPNSPIRILDLGTGSGALTLALARHYSQARTTAVDQSVASLSLAQENAAALNLADRIDFRESDWFDAVEGCFDLIVANPPYLSRKEVFSAEPEVRKYEPEKALVSGKRGLADLKAILKQAPYYLNPGGVLALETGIDHHNKLKEIARRTGYFHWRSLKDLNRYDRFFFVWKKAISR